MDIASLEKSLQASKSRSAARPELSVTPSPSLPRRTRSPSPVTPTSPKDLNYDSMTLFHPNFPNSFELSLSDNHLLPQSLSQNVPPAILLRFLREHRSEWADNNIDAYSAAAVTVGPCSLAGSRVGSFEGQVILPLAHTIEDEEFLEVIKLEGVGHSPEDAMMPREMFLLQLCSGVDENAVGSCAELIFAPIDASFADDAPLLPSGFRIIPLDYGKVQIKPAKKKPDVGMSSVMILEVSGKTRRHHVLSRK